MKNNKLKIRIIREFDALKLKGAVKSKIELCNYVSKEVIAVENLTESDFERLLSKSKILSEALDSELQEENKPLLDVYEATLEEKVKAGALAVTSFFLGKSSCDRFSDKDGLRAFVKVTLSVFEVKKEEIARKEEKPLLGTGFLLKGMELRVLSDNGETITATPNWLACNLVRLVIAASSGKIEGSPASIKLATQLDSVARSADIHWRWATSKEVSDFKDWGRNREFAKLKCELLDAMYALNEDTLVKRLKKGLFRYVGYEAVYSNQMPEQANCYNLMKYTSKNQRMKDSDNKVLIPVCVISGELAKSLRTKSIKMILAKKADAAGSVA